MSRTLKIFESVPPTQTEYTEKGQEFPPKFIHPIFLLTLDITDKELQTSV